jgi:hypothetical protein
MAELVTLTVENFPAGLRKRLRVMAAERETTLRQILIDAAERVLAEPARDGGCTCPPNRSITRQGHDPRCMSRLTDPAPGEIPLRRVDPGF